MYRSRYVHIMLDNLRIGGIQRLALDEAYSLSELGFKVCLVVLEPENLIDDIREIDNGFFERNQIEVIFVPTGRWQQLHWFIEFIKERNPHTILCHSAKSVGLLRFSSFLTFKKLHLVAFLHQLASLSSTVQRAKRYLLFSMADEIRTSSRQFILEFEKSYRVFLKFNLGLKGRISFDRMGIYLPRIDWNQENSISAEISLKPALVFNSRITEWKGFETFINLAKHLGEEFQYILITSRMTHQNQLIESFISLPTSKVFFGKSVSNFLWEIPAIHIYPTRYGEKVKFPQSIGLNVLECLALGIPSMISEEGFESWPELQNSAAIFVTNWEIDETVRAIRKITESNPKILRTSYNSFHQFISIEQHLNQILNLFE